jgi:hypothetical protein
MNGSDYRSIFRQAKASKQRLHPIFSPTARLSQSLTVWGEQE